MKALVTGSAGFVGSHVVRRAAQQASQVIALVSPSGRLSRLDGVPSNVSLVRGDLGDADTIERLAEMRPELCIHSAWNGGVDYIDSFRNIESIAMTLRLAARLGEVGCRHFVGLGTCLEYDTDVAHPLAEDAALAPRRLYSAGKLGTWKALEQIGRLTGMSTAWARLFYLYGPFEDVPRLVPSVARGLLLDTEVPTSPGEQIRDFLHVADAASAVWAVALAKLEGPVNVGSGVPITVGQLVREIGVIVGRSHLVKAGALPYRSGDPMYVCADNRRLVKESGWRPEFTLQAGLADAIAWWRRALVGSASETRHDST